MTPISSTSSSSRRSVLVFSLTIIVSLYWFLSQLINVYKSPILGGIYELLWIGMVIALFGLPVFSFVYWAKSKFEIKSLYLYSFIISAATVLILVTQFD